MKTKKEIQQALITSIFVLNFTSKTKNENISKLCDEYFNVILNGNTNLLTFACIGQSEKEMIEQVKLLLKEAIDKEIVE